MLPGDYGTLFSAIRQTPDNMCLGPNFNASRLGNRLRFFSSVKSSWAPIIQISTYTEMKENEKL